MFRGCWVSSLPTEFDVCSESDRQSVGGPAGIRTSVLAISQVERLPDGRIAARVEVEPSDGSGDSPTALTVVLEQGEDSAWRFDNIRALGDLVGVAGVADPDLAAPPRALLRHPIAPGPASTRFPHQG